MCPVFFLEQQNDPVNRYCQPHNIGHDIGASHDAGADSAARQLDRKSRLRMRRGQDPCGRRLRGKNHHPPDPPSSSPVRTMARRRLRSLLVSTVASPKIEATPNLDAEGPRNGGLHFLDRET